jgi:cell volume regulation protein A
MEAPTSIEIAGQTLLSCGIILAIGTIAASLTQKIGIPDIAVFLIVGLVIGPDDRTVRR